MSATYVFGHKNPDNDSVSSAVAYAYLKNQLNPHETYIPARLGPMPKETTWVFDRYGIETPMAIPHVHKRVCDVMTSPVISIDHDKSMLEAGRTFRQRAIRALVVTDEEGKYLGLITSRILAELYVAETDVVGFNTAPLSLADLAASFEGRIVVGEPDAVLNGHLIIAASEPETVAKAIAPGDTVILGDRKRTQPIALDAGAACIILSCDAQPEPEIVQLAKNRGSALLCSKHDTYTTARFASLAQTVENCIETDVLTFSPEDLLTEASEDLLASSHREAVVLDEEGYCIGIVTRSDIARGTKRKVILVDHNEISQSAAGIKEAEVCEIVDHHRVGDIETSNPILFLNLPLGSSATIVAREYFMHGVPVPCSMAAALLSAIMTDTVLLKSPTTTSIDKDMAAQLGAIIDCDPLEFGMEVIRSRGGGAAVKIEDVIATDAKEYRFGDNVIMIAQHETVDLKSLLSREDELLEAMEAMSAARGYNTFLLLITDIVAEGSQFLCVGKQRVVERAFDISFAEGSVFMPGVLSRKKQVVGRLIEHGA